MLLSSVSRSLEVLVPHLPWIIVMCFNPRIMFGDVKDASDGFN